MGAGQIIISRTASDLDVNIADQNELVRAFALHEACRMLHSLRSRKCATRGCLHRCASVRLAGVVSLAQCLGIGRKDRCSKKKQTRNKCAVLRHTVNLAAGLVVRRWRLCCL